MAASYAMKDVSIPDGKPRPFRLNELPGIVLSCYRFNPRREASPFQTLSRLRDDLLDTLVSIPDGKPRPFRRQRNPPGFRSHLQFQSQTGSLALSDLVLLVLILSMHTSFNPRREASPFQTLLSVTVLESHTGFNPRREASPFQTGH